MFYDVREFCKKHDIKEELDLVSPLLLSKWGYRKRIIKALRIVLRAKTGYNWSYARNSGIVPFGNGWTFHASVGKSDKIDSLQVRFIANRHFPVYAKFTFQIKD